jgi:hypothetical protein
MADTQTWIQKHEKPVIYTLVLAVVLFLGNKYLNYESARADARNQAAQQTLATQKEANDKLAVQNQEAQQQYQSLLGQLNAQNAKLTAEMVTLGQSLAARQKQDSVLPAPDLALRHEALLGISSGVSSTENGFIVSSPAEIQTVQNLESLPVARQQLADETTLATDKDKQITSLGGVVNGLNTQIAGLNSQLVDSGAACKAEVAVARKSRWKWFKAGAVVGFAAGVLTGRYL